MPSARTRASRKGAKTPTSAVKVRGAIFVLLWLSAFPAVAAQPPLICFGNEPSWSLEFVEPGAARLAFPGERPTEYRGSETRVDVLRERAWRGKLASGVGGDLVAFLRESACSDTMSDTRHPLTARVSLPDGRFLAGCCRVPESPPATPGPPVALEGPTWRLVDLRGQDPGASGAAERPVTARFDAGRIAGFSGCNQFVGAYTRDGDRLTIGSLAGTMMACRESAMALETRVMAALAGTFRYAIANDRLTLTPASGAPLAFAAEPAPALEGVAWEITGFNNGRHAVVSPVLGTSLTLSFRDGAATGSSGCNTFRATYTREGNRVVIGPAAATRMTCVGEGVMAQEREFLAALQSATTWDVSAGLLDMHRPDGERALTARGGGR